MKKSTKFFCGLSFFCIFLGLILCGVGLAFGGNFNEFSKVFADSKILSYFYRNDNSELDKDALIWENPDFSEQNYFFVDVKGKNNPIKNLEINVDSCNLVFLQGEELSVKAKNLLESNVTCKITKSGNLIIQDSPTFGLQNIFNTKQYSKNGTIEVTFPASMNFDKITVNNINGSVAILYNSFVCNKLALTNENGNITLSKIESKNSDIYTNYGTVNLSGKFLNQTKIGCAYGKIDMEIDNDFSYEIAGGIGNVAINYESFSSSRKIATLKKQNNIKVDCKLGTVKIVSK